MRVAFFITLLLAVLSIGYSVVGEAREVKRYSDVHAMLNEWRQAGHALPDEATERLDGIVSRMRGEWRVARGVSVLTAVAAVVGLVSASRRKKI